MEPWSQHVIPVSYHGDLLQSSHDLGSHLSLQHHATPFSHDPSVPEPVVSWHVLLQAALANLIHPQWASELRLLVP